METSVDVAVIGSGPGGEGAAIQAAKQGLSVCVIEEFRMVGGSCTHLGTIPSKALRHVATQLSQNGGEFSYDNLLMKAKAIIKQQVELRSSHYLRNDIKVYHGRAKLLNPHTVHVFQSDVHTETIQAKYVILATGSRPYRPVGVDFSHSRVFDSDTILKLSCDARVITVYGAGVIGCEYTSIFRNLGKKVNLINTKEQLLSFLDREISDALSYHLRDQGVLIKNNEHIALIETNDHEVVTHLVSGKKIRSDIILFALGRTGNSRGIGLEDLGIQILKNDLIQVNDSFQTSQPNIYAVGDVVGFPSLASTAYDQGRHAARHISDKESATKLCQNLPFGIYTNPEISSVGKTEEELTNEKVPYEVGHAAFRHLARAQINGQQVGMLKILFHCETLEILGIHCFGQHATEIIHIGQAIMRQPGSYNSIRYFVDTTFNYPTMAEAYRVAALNGLNRLCK